MSPVSEQVSEQVSDEGGDAAKDAPDARQAPHRPGGFTPIRDYALIGDMRTGALVSKTGSIDWLCLPDFHSEALLSGILDPLRGGSLFTGPRRCDRVTRRYVENAPILETRFETGDGVLTVRDFMALASDDRRRAFHPQRRLVRIVEAESGNPEVTLRFAPRPGFGRSVPRLKKRGKLGWSLADGHAFLLFQSDLEHESTSQGVLQGTTRLAEGERRSVSLSFCDRDIGVVPPIGAEACASELDETLGWWQRWLGRLDYDGPFRAEVFRSAMALRMLTFSQSGAVVAAATSSLPEVIGGPRNYDYRFCWLRDSSFILRSFLGLGYLAEAQGFFEWLMHATQLSAPRLQTVYTVYGRTDVSEQKIQSLQGYRGSTPVNTGNGAESQLQLDIYGAVLSAAVLFLSHGGEIGRSERRRLEGLAKVVCDDWTLPDNGIWEMPGGRKHNTYSKAMCWAALDSAVQLKERGLISDPGDRFASERDAIRRVTLEQGWNDRVGAFVGAFGHDWLDASALLLPRIGFIEPNEPRMVATFEKIEAKLGQGAQIRRYHDSVDPLPGKEGAFVACGFWAAEYLARRGDTQAARDRVSRVLEAANDVGLMSEEIDCDTGEALGNMPQGYSHTSLINAALAIKEAEEGRRPEQT